MTDYIRNLILIGVGIYVLTVAFANLLTATDTGTTLFRTLVPIMLALGGAIYAITGAMRIGKSGGD